MSKYNLSDILNEYIGGGRIGTLKISFKDLQDKMDELENYIEGHELKLFSTPQI